MLYFCFSKETQFDHRTAGQSLVKEYLHIWRTLPEIELFLVTEGDLYIEQGGRKFHLKRGEYLLTEPDVEYGGYEPSNARFHWLHFICSADQAGFSVVPKSDFSLPQCGKLKVNDSLFIIDSLIEQYSMAGGKKAVTDMLMAALMRELCALMTEREQTEYKDKRFQPIMDYFHNNPYYNEFKDVRSMAEHFGYSEKYLIYLFKRNTGLSPLQYLTKKKLLRAEEMLANSDMTVKGIAGMLHYDYYYFMRLFRKATGMTPTQYRKTVIPDWSKYLPKK